MSDSKMVIMWKNEDGTVTLSQRTSPYEVMPTVDSNPPRIAATSLAASSVYDSSQAENEALLINSVAHIGPQACLHHSCMFESNNG